MAYHPINYSVTTSTICIPVKSKCNVKIFLPESLVPCLQHKNNLRVNKISLFLYI